MTNEQFKSLRRGDVIRGLCSGTAFVVDAHYGDFVIAMKSMHISNPSEWELCASENSGAVDNSAQQLKAEIAALVVKVGAIPQRELPLMVGEFIERMRQLSAV